MQLAVHAEMRRRKRISGKEFLMLIIQHIVVIRHFARPFATAEKLIQIITHLDGGPPLNSLQSR